MDIEARLLRIESMLKEAGLHEPGCPARHNCNRDHPTMDIACLPRPCSCWLRVDSDPQVD